MTPRQEQESGLLQKSTTGEVACEHTEQMTGDLDIEYLIARKAAIWRRAVATEAPVKKKIIISDWAHRVHLFADEKNGDYYSSADLEKWRYLLAKGYELYAWTGQVTPISNESELLTCLDRVSPIETNTLRKRLGEQGWEADAIFIANFNRSRELTQLCNTAFRTCNTEQEKKITELKLSDLINFDDKLLNKLIGTISDTPKICIVLDKLNDKKMQHLLKQEAIKLLLSKHNLVVDARTENDKLVVALFQSLPKINSLKIITGINKNILHEIFEACPQIKELDIDNKGRAKMLTLPSQLESLTLSEFNYSALSVAAISTEYNKVKKYVVTLDDNDFMFDHKEYPGLDSIEEMSIELKSDFFGPAVPFLMGCKNLKKMTVSYHPEANEQAKKKLDSNSYPPPNNQPLPELTLEELTFTNLTLNWLILKVIINASPALKRLNLSTCKIQSTADTDVQLEGKLNNLEELAVSYSKIKDKQLSSILTSSPKLTALTISSCERITHACMEGLHCPSVTSLNIGVYYSYPINPVEYIAAATKAFPNISVLKLNLRTEHANEIIELIGQWKQLTEIHISRLSETRIRRVLDVCHNLKYVNFEQSSFYGTAFGTLFSTLKNDYPHIIFNCQVNPLANQQTKSSPPSTPQTTTNPDKMVLNGNTNPATPSQTQRVFHPKENGEPVPNHYRTSVFCDTKQSLTQYELFNHHETYELVNVIQETKEQIETQYFQHEATSTNIYLGEVLVPKGTRADQSVKLPGLSPNDKILSISTDPPQSLEVIRCLETGCYKVQLSAPTSQNTVISYRLESDIERYPDPHPDDLPDIKKVRDELIRNPHMIFDPASNIYLQSLLMFFRNFPSNEALDGTFEAPDELLKAIITQQKGVCEHRVIAFMAVAKIHGITARAVGNDIHAYVEILDIRTQRWLIADLGGKPIENLLINELPSQQKPNTVSPAKQQPQANDDEMEFDSTKSDAATVTFNPDNPFKTWNTLPSTATDTHQYCAELLNHAAQLQADTRNLLCVVDQGQAESLHASLSSTVTRGGNRCYTITDLDDINANTTMIDNKTGDTHLIDSPLMTFLKSAQAGDVLVVDWASYQARHVSLNSMVDADQRKLLGIPIPAGVVVVGMLDKSQQMREDFYSRFSVKSRMPETIVPIAVKPPVNHTLTAIQENQPCINFYDDEWRSALLGEFRIVKDNKFAFEESNFIKALRAGKTEFVFRNAPWHLAEFRAFMLDVVTQHKVTINGETIHCAAMPSIFNYTSPYPLHIGAHQLFSDTSTCPSDSMIINTQTVNRLYTTYFCNEHGNFDELPGMLKQRSNQLVTIIMTESLTNAQWSKLLNTANANHVSLNIHIAPGVIVPSELKDSLQKTASNLQGDNTHTTNRIIVTNDIDYINNDEQAKTIPYHPFPISEKTTYSDLIETIKTNHQADGSICYQHQTSALAALLLSGEKVVLTGNMSPQLARQLETLFCETPHLMLNGKLHYIAKDQLKLICSVTPPFHLLPVVTNQVSNAMRWEKLTYQFSSRDITTLRTLTTDFCREAKLPDFSYIQLVTMLNHMQDHPDSNPLKPLLRLRKDYMTLGPIAAKFWKRNKPKVNNNSDDPNQKRYQKVEKILENSPYVFIAGPSGVGKSKFIHDEMKKRGWTIFEGTEDLAAILQQAKQSGEPTLIFIDEANFGNSKIFSMLENIWNQPPTLLVDGQLQTPPPNVKFAFAGNFGHFQGRQQHELFARHGGVITFKELPDSYLIDKILRPTLNKVYTGVKQNNIAETLLKCYHHINQLLPDSHPLTARNLHNMAMRLAHYPAGLSASELACMSAYDEVAGILNKTERKQFANWLQQEFKIDAVKATKQQLKSQTKLTSPLNTSGKFKMTKKRVNPARIMQQAFKVRETKMNHPELATQGTAGILIEGESGIGKSLLAVAFLESAGFHNGHTVAAGISIDTTKLYYHITSVDRDDIIKQLHKAFHEGATVIIDELNTLELEEILNKFLSGRDLAGQLAKQSGFFVIGTQNPVSYGNRKRLSPAFANRFDKLNLKEYGQDDLIELTQNKVLVEQFMAASAHAKAHQLEPGPTPRDLIKKK
jgi:DNA replication protein DnaC